MSAAMVFRHEMRQFGLGLVAGPVVGLGVVGLPLLVDPTKAWAPGDWWELGALMGLVVALALVGCQAATTLAGPLKARRSGFELSRPLSLGAMVGGRLAASGVLGVLAYLGTLLLPALTHAGGAGTALTTVTAGLGLTAAASLACAVLAHPLSVGLRARSPWLGLEWAGALILGLTMVWGLRRLAPVMLIRGIDLGWFLGTVGVLVLGLLVVASWRGLDQGRVLLQAVHRTQARLLGTGLLVLALGVGVYAGWMGRVVAPWEHKTNGYLFGFAGDWVADFEHLWNHRTGAWLEVGVGPRLDPMGRRAAWMTDAGHLAVVDLQGAPRKTLLELRTWGERGWVAAFTPDARGVLVQGTGLGFVDLSQGQLIWTNPKVRLLEVLDGRRGLGKVGGKLVDLDLATGETRPRFAGELPKLNLRAIDETGGRLLLSGETDGRVFLGEGASLVDLGPSVGLPTGTFLEDGSLLILRRAAPGQPYRLEHRGLDGRVRELPLPGEIAQPDRLQKGRTPGVVDLVAQDGRGRDGLWSMEVATGKTWREVDGALLVRAGRLEPKIAPTRRLWVQDGRLLVGEPGHLVPLPKGPHLSL